MIRIDGYPIDCALEERINYEAEVTMNPVEKGADTTDHVTARLPTLEFDGVVSDTPIGAIANDETRTSATEDQSKVAYKKFLDVFLARQTVVVECSFGKFESMILQTLSPVKNAQVKKAFKFTATFQQIKIVENARTTVKTSIRNGSKTEKNGLSLDNLIDGKKVLWRKGKPPGSSPATDPAGVITGQEIVTIKGKHFYHEDRKTQLNAAELDAFTADLNRDSALASRRKLAVIDERLEKTEKRIKAAQDLLDYKEKHPGEKVDPALFGL